MNPKAKGTFFLLTSHFTRGAVASFGQVFWLGHLRAAPPSQFPSDIWRALLPYSDEFAQDLHLFPFSAGLLARPDTQNFYSVFYAMIPQHFLAVKPINKRPDSLWPFIDFHILPEVFAKFPQSIQAGAL